MRQALYYSLPFILCVLAEMNQVEHFPQSASYPVAIGMLQLGSGEVGGYVCFELEVHKEVVTGKQDFGQHIAFITVVFEVLLRAQVIEAIFNFFVLAGSKAAVTADGFVAITDELKTDLSA